MTTFKITRIYDDGSIGIEADADSQLREFWWCWSPELSTGSITVGGPNADEIAMLHIDEHEVVTPERLVHILTEHYADPANVDALLAHWFQWVVRYPNVLDELIEDEQDRWVYGD
jgi:hypothetical protein